MRKLILYIFILFASELLAQDNPQFSQYINLQGIINPAYNGSRETYSILGVQRRQWVGMQTTAVNAHAPLPLGNMGAGLVFVQDQLGLFKNTTITGALSYSIPISDNIKLSTGLQAGIVSYGVDPALTPDGISSVDPALDNFREPYTRLSVGLGFFMHSEKFFVGLSLPEVMPYRSKLGDSEIYENVPAYLYGGGVFSVGESVKLKPTALVQATYGMPLMGEVGLYAFYKDFGSLGVLTRASTYPLSSVILAAEVQALPGLFVGYSYDLTLAGRADDNGNITQIGKGAHEISLRFDIGAEKILKKRMNSLRYF
jgi:type IX secretion system PorP/SprF family membrane protein